MRPRAAALMRWPPARICGGVRARCFHSRNSFCQNVLSLGAGRLSRGLVDLSIGRSGFVFANLRSTIALDRSHRNSPAKSTRLIVKNNDSTMLGISRIKGREQGSGLPHRRRPSSKSPARSPARAQFASFNFPNNLICARGSSVQRSRAEVSRIVGASLTLHPQSASPRSRANSRTRRPHRAEWRA